VPDSILRAALLARAQEDISRIIEIRTRKQALSTLLARGVVGDEIWQRLLRAEQELELEVKDVVQEVCLFTFTVPKL
jgi:translocation protein SEC66